MTQVNPRPNETIDNLLIRFKKAVENSGVLADYRKNERYNKPSVKRKMKQMAARKRRLKNNKGKPVEKVRKNNWKWNYNRTKKIPLPNYSASPSRDSSSGGYKGNSNYKGNSSPNYKGNSNYKGGTNQTRSTYKKPDKQQSKSVPLTKDQIDKALKGSFKFKNSK